jgi:phospho-N-acetylmuramoyl-pentapeptide-transferase
VIALAWAPWLIAKLRQYKLGKQIRAEGPSSHSVKAGTPTMGGWLIIVTTCALTVIFLQDWRIAAPLVLGVLLFAIYGTVDDFANLRSKEGLGLRVRYKFLWHNGMALVVTMAVYWLAGVQTIALPWLGQYQIGWWIIPLGMVTIFATTSGVNEIDGLDGLAGGTTALAYAAFAAIAAINGNAQVAMFCAIMVGAILAFLWFNVHPARVFMGDTGSLALGAGLATAALLTNWVLLLPIIGLPFVVETLSVMMQVTYFKATGGKRIFKMSPLHHHFELSGWPEVQVVQRFWIFGALAAAAGLFLAVV